MENGIALQNISKIYRKGSNKVVVFNDLNMTINKGEFVALMGPSGSGKTTVLHLMGGLDRPTAGEVLVGNKLISTSSEAELTRWRARHVGFIFQSNHLLPVLSAFANVELPLALTRLNKAEPTGNLDRKTADAILSLLHTLNRDFGKTIVMVTHDAKAADVATRVINLEQTINSNADIAIPGAMA